MSGTDSTEYAEFCGDSLLEREKRAQWIHRNDGVVSVLREVDPVGTVHSGLVGDVVAAIHDRGFGVVLRVESIKRAYIFHELVATDREGARLFPICQVLVGYSEFDPRNEQAMNPRPSP